MCGKNLRHMPGAQARAPTQVRTCQGLWPDWHCSGHTRNAGLQGKKRGGTAGNSGAGGGKGQDPPTARKSTALRGGRPTTGRGDTCSTVKARQNKCGRDAPQAHVRNTIHGGSQPIPHLHGQKHHLSAIIQQCYPGRSSACAKLSRTLPRTHLRCHHLPPSYSRPILDD